MTYNITITGLDETMEKMGFLSDYIRKNKKTMLLNMSQSLKAELRANAPVGSQERMDGKAPGGLKRSIEVTAVSDSGATVVVGQGIGYAAAVEAGAKGRVITPRLARVLAFKKGGSVVFAPRVIWPGFKGSFFVKKTLKSFVKTLDSILRKWSDGMARAWNGAK